MKLFSISSFNIKLVHTQNIVLIFSVQNRILINMFTSQSLRF